MLEIDRSTSVSTSQISVPIPVVLHQRRTRLSSVPLIEIGQQATSKGGCTSYPVIAVGRRRSTSTRYEVERSAGPLKGGICSVSDTMESLRGGGANSPLSPPNVRIKHLTRNQEGSSRFPKLDDGAHFHYENVELGPIKVCICEQRPDISKALNGADKENEGGQCWFSVQVTSNSRCWMIRRSYENFRMFDRQLHRCVYDRKYSLLQELPTSDSTADAEKEEGFHATLSEYLSRFSQLAGSLINCGTVLNWLELDNRGNRLIVTDEAAINTPAVAAAYVVKRYNAQASDEISFEVGDMVSVIDMPPPEESTWWRGKKGFEVGFFPCECVEIIGDKVPQTLKVPKAPSKPVLRKHGKLIAFFRSFLLSRPSRKKLKQSGILKERVFGCDLGEHLMNTGRDIPLVLKCCAEFIERHGIADGIYRLSGVTSNIQKLRVAFDEDRVPDLKDEAIIQDIHCVASLLKMYFRELPNPLLTYHLYEKFVTAVQSDDDVRLLRLRDIVQQLPPPHYRTLEYLMKHLTRVAAHGQQTGMTPKNVAIVWAPNLLRSKDLEGGGVGALHVVGVQAVLTEYLIRYSDLLFSEKMPVFHSPVSGDDTPRKTRPKSLAISTPTKLLSLEEARSRALTANLPQSHQKYIDVGGGPKTLPPKYHTVIDLPNGKRNGTKLKKSPSGWKSFFHRSGGREKERVVARRHISSPHKISTNSLPYNPLSIQAVTETDFVHNSSKKLRTVKSAESLISSVGGNASCRNSGVLDQSSLLTTDVGKFNWNLLERSSEEISQVCHCNISKSPSIHRHIRSISHDSYFEHMMDVPAEEQEMDADDESVFQLYHDMEEIEESKTNVLHNGSLHSEPNSNNGCLDGGDFHYGEQPMDSCISVQNSRKQKLHSSDSDVGSPKVQKLNHSRSSSGRSTSARNIEVFLSKTQNADSPTLEIVSCNADIEEKTKTELNIELICNKTIIERYGNEETILVEVHATQDVSDDEVEASQDRTSKSLPPPEIAGRRSESCEFGTSTAEEMIRSIAPSLFARDSSMEDSELYSNFSIEGTISETPSVHKSFDTPDQYLLLDSLPFEAASLLSPTGIDTSLSTPESPTMANISEMPSSSSGSDVSDAPDIAIEAEEKFPQMESSHSESPKLITEFTMQENSDISERKPELSGEPISAVDIHLDVSQHDVADRESHVSELVTVVNKTVRFQLNPMEIFGDESETSSEMLEMENQPIYECDVRQRDLPVLDTQKQVPTKISPKEMDLNFKESKENDISTAVVKTPIKNSSLPVYGHFLDDTRLHNITSNSSCDSLKRRSFAERLSPVSPFDDSRRKFESEIGRTIVRDHQMRLEMEQIQAEGQKKALQKHDVAKCAKTASEKKELSKNHKEVSFGNNKYSLEGVELRRSSAVYAVDTPAEQSILEKKRISEPSVKSDLMVPVDGKRHSEPLNISKYKLTEKKSIKDLMSKFETSGSVKEPVESEPNHPKQTTPPPPHAESPTKTKATQPSLYTQLKVLKLQSLHSGTSPTDAHHPDPWSDPILDIFEKSENEKTVLLSPPSESYPLVDTSNFTSVDDFLDRKVNISRPQTLDLLSSKMDDFTESEKENDCRAYISPSPRSEEFCESDRQERRSPVVTSFNQSPSDFVKNLDEVGRSSPKSSVISAISPCSPDESADASGNNPAQGEELEAIRRERINRYKEERRAQLQEKLKTESFRVKAEEKEKVQSQFRHRKNSKQTSPLNEDEPRRRSLSPKKGVRSPADASQERSKSSPGTPVRDTRETKSESIFDWSKASTVEVDFLGATDCVQRKGAVRHSSNFIVVQANESGSLVDEVKDGSGTTLNVPMKATQKTEPTILVKSGTFGSKSSGGPVALSSKCIRDRAAMFECPKESLAQHQRQGSTVSRH